MTSLLVCLSIILSFIGGCRSRDTANDASTPKVSLDDVSTTEADAVRLALVDLGNDLPAVSSAALEQIKGLGEVEVIVAKDYSRSLRESLIGSVGYLRSLSRQADSVVRRDSYKLTSDLKPFSISGLGKTLNFPFTLQAGGTLEIGRVFKDRATALAAPPFAFIDLPLSIEKMLQLPAGTYVNLPIKGTLAFEASGNFLAEAYQYARDLGKFLNATSAGTYSHTNQGTLLAQGVFALQFLRLDGDKVRVRVVHGDDLVASASRSWGFDVKARLAFIPSSPLQKIRDLKEQLDQGVKANPVRTRLNDIKSRVEEFKSITQSEIRQLIEQTPAELRNTEVERWLAAARGKTDKALEQAEKLDAKLADLDRLVFGRADRMLERIDSVYKPRIEPILDKIQQHTDRELDVKNAVTLNGDITRKMRTVADYIFDLSDPVAREALEHAYFARTAWLGVSGTSQRDLTSNLLYDFATVESLATADQNSRSPRVIRLVHALREFRETHLGLNFQALFIKAGLDDHFRENTVEVIDRGGKRDSWYSRVWEFTQNFKLARFLEAEESYTSGFLTPKDSNDLRDGAYWFAWEGRFAEREKMPIKRTLEAAYSFLGPIAVEQSLAAIYAGEFAGKVTGRVQASFNGDFLRAFFDPKKATDSLLWKALANVANNLNAAEFGIPFTDNNIQPLGLDQIPGAEEACDQVAMQWGRLYCTVFQDDFLAKLRALRNNPDPVARLEFFENYYKIGFLFNRLGTKLLVRYLAEVAHQLELSEKISIQVDIRNAQNSSSEASPHLKGGEARDIRLLESLNLIEGARP